MDASRFNGLARAWSASRTRRGAAALLGTAFLFPLAGVLPADAKKKKITLCLDGQTIKASKKKKKKLLKQGATPGACPPVCIPACAEPACGGDDGCGGICGCAANALCHEGTCRPCTVTCTGSGADCGVALSVALNGGGLIYACPGRYVGSFSAGTDVMLIGAGKGSDPSTNTILDANEQGRVLAIASSVTATLKGVRITGGNLPSDAGGGIRNFGRLSIDNCAVADNTADIGGGIFHPALATGPVTVKDSIIADNTAALGGGLDLNNGTHGLTVQNSVISGNTSTAGNGAGGGIYNIGTPIIMQGSDITGNSAANIGGGIYNNSASLTFDSACNITGNTAVNGGGGIQNAGGTVNLNDATVSGNSSPQCVNVPGC